MKWLIEPNTKEVKDVLGEFIKEANKEFEKATGREYNTMGFKVFVPPMFLESYEDDGKLYVEYPLDTKKSGFLGFALGLQLRRADKMIKKYFEAKGIKIKIKRVED